MTTNIVMAFVTAYLATGHPNAAGHKPVVGTSIAVPRNVPLGSKVVICGHTYTADDRTAKRFDGRFDIFFGDQTNIFAAKRFGKQLLQVTIITGK